eukprot:1362256-Amphidinium_carterae.1
MVSPLALTSDSNGSDRRSAAHKRRTTDYSSGIASFANALTGVRKACPILNSAVKRDSCRA